MKSKKKKLKEVNISCSGGKREWVSDRWRLGIGPINNFGLSTQKVGVRSACVCVSVLPQFLGLNCRRYYWSWVFRPLIWAAKTPSVSPPPQPSTPPKKQKKSALLTGLRDCRKSFHHRQFRSCPKLEDVFLAYVPTSQHRSAKSAPHPQIYRTPSLVGSEIYLGHPPLNSTDIFCKWICFQLVILVTLK